MAPAPFQGLGFSDQEVFETVRMVEMEHLDIRAVTIGISLRGCVDTSVAAVAEKVHARVTSAARRLVEVCTDIEAELGVPIVNKRVSVTPVSLLCDALGGADVTPIAAALDAAAVETGVDFLGGFSALIQKGITPGDRALLDAIPSALSTTERVCSSVNIGTSRAGINMDAVLDMGRVIRATAEATADRDSIGCAKLVTFANIPEDNPFMAGALHGVGEAETVINVGVSGPGVVRAAIEAQGPDADLGTMADAIKRVAFKITRVGELCGREAARRLGIEFGIVDLSLAPTPVIGDSVAEALCALGLEQVGGPGSTAALMLLTDAVKKGGAMASSYVGGLSGAFIPVSEDDGMVRAVESGALSLEKLEAMTAVCSVGLDMVVIPGDTPIETLAAIIADEAAIGVVNNKTTAVRIIPAIGRSAGERVDFGGLLGGAPVMPIRRVGAYGFIRRGGRIPGPIQAMKN